MECTTDRDLIKRWRRQIARNSRRRAASPLRPVAAIGFLTTPPYPPDYVEIDQLLTVVVRDDARPAAPPAIRVSGYGVSVVPHGVQWGGAANEKLLKDLSRCPVRHGRRRLRRLDRSNTKLLELALQLERRIQQADRYGQRCRVQPLLPRLWAGFRQSVAADLHGQGPEFEQLCDRFGMSAEAMFFKFERRWNGLCLFPLEFVSDQLAAASAVLAEMTDVRRRQVVRLKRLPGSLVGHCGACAYDYFSSRFRPAREAVFASATNVRCGRLFRPLRHNAMSPVAGCATSGGTAPCRS